MTTNDMVCQLSERLGVPKKEAKAIFHAFLDTIKVQVFERDSEVQIENFGRFSMGETPARLGRNPKTGTPAIIKARSKLKFAPSANFKAQISSRLERGLL